MLRDFIRPSLLTLGFDSDASWDIGRGWIGAGLSYDNSGKFYGFWAPAEGDAGAAYLDREPVPSEYTFLSGACDWW